MGDPGEFDDEPVDHGADHRPDVYREDGKWVFRASSLGNCEANLIRQALGQTPAPPPDFMLEAFKQGNTNEPIILGKLKAKGWKPLDAGIIEAYGFDRDASGQLCTELKVGTKALIRCHPDEVMQCFKTTEESRLAGAEVGQRRVVEAKALAKSWTFDRFYREKAAWQTSVEVATTGLPLLFVVGWKDPETKIVTDDVEYIVPDKPIYSKGQIIARVMKLVRAIEAIEAGTGELPECDYAMYPCGFYALHNLESGVHAKAETPKADEVLTKSAAIKLRATLALWRGDIKTMNAAKERVDGHREAIELLLRANKVEGAVQCGSTKIAYTPESTTRKFKRGAVERMVADGLPVEAYREDSKRKAYVTLTDETLKTEGK